MTWSGKDEGITRNDERKRDAAFLGTFCLSDDRQAPLGSGDAGTFAKRRASNVAYPAL